MTEIVTPIDHQEEGAALMLSQFKDSPNLLNLLKSWLLPLNELEDCLQDWAMHNGITTAYGDFLDVIGSWMGVDRNLMLDEQYRQAILAQALLEGMDGTTEKLLDGMRVICQTNSVTFHELYPATVYAHCGDGYNSVTYLQIKRIVAAGIHLRVLLDHFLDSMLMSEILEQDNGLITGEGDQYVVIVDGEQFDLVTSIADSAVTTGGDYPAETFDTEWTPMAEMVTAENALSTGLIIDNNGGYVLDLEGNRLQYRELI